MLRRLGYRRILPIANLLLFLALVGFEDWGLLEKVHLYRDMNASRISMGKVPWDTVFIAGPRPVPTEPTTAINLPAYLFAVPFGLPNKGWRTDLIVGAVAALDVVPPWFSMGRWLDHRARASVGGGRLLTIFRLTGLGILELCVFASLQLPAALSSFVCLLPMFCWPDFLACVARWELRAARDQPLAIGSA